MNKTVNGNTVCIRDITPDMGELVRMDLIKQEDGDVIISLHTIDRTHFITAEFCTSQGGGHQPVIAKKLRDLITALLDLEPNWKARALVRGKVKNKCFYADSLIHAQERAAAFFPRHEPHNIRLTALKEKP